MEKNRQATVFETRVYTAVSKVPAGNVISYKILGSFLGCASAQAIGNALRRNPYAPEVPCHRVISSSLKLGGYMGEVSGERVERKKQLLENEGVFFDTRGFLIDKTQLLCSLDM